MIITYSDGRAVEAALLTRTAGAIRVAIEGSEDVTEFWQVNGHWVSEHCELAQIEFAWQRKNCKPPVAEEDCCWTPDQAARLIRLLTTDSKEDEDLALPSVSAAEAAEALFMAMPAAVLVN